MLQTAYQIGYRAAFLKYAAKASVAAPPTPGVNKAKPTSPTKPAALSGAAEHPQTTPGGSGQGFTAAQSSGISPGVADAGIAGLGQNY